MRLVDDVLCVPCLLSPGYLGIRISTHLSTRLLLPATPVTHLPWIPIASILLTLQYLNTRGDVFGSQSPLGLRTSNFKF